MEHAWPCSIEEQPLALCVEKFAIHNMVVLTVRGLKTHKNKVYLRIP